MTSKLSININTELDTSINVYLQNCTRIILKQCGEIYIILTEPTRPLPKTKPQTKPYSTLQRGKVMNSQMRNKRGGQSKNTASTCRMNVYTNSKRSLPKEPNQEFSNYHRGHPHIRSHLWPLNTHNTRQVDQKFP